MSGWTQTSASRKTRYCPLAWAAPRFRARAGPRGRRAGDIRSYRPSQGVPRALSSRHQHQNVKIFIRGSREGCQALLQVVGAVIYRYDHRQSRTFAGVSWSQCWRLDGHYALVGRRHSVSLRVELYVIEDYGTFRVETLVLKSTVSPASQGRGTQDPFLSSTRTDVQWIDMP